MSSNCSTCVYNIEKGQPKPNYPLDAGKGHMCANCAEFVHKWCLFPNKDGGLPTCRPCHDDVTSLTQLDNVSGASSAEQSAKEDLRVKNSASEPSGHVSPPMDIGESSVAFEYAVEDDQEVNPQSTNTDEGRLHKTGITSPMESGTEQISSSACTQEQRKMRPASLDAVVPVAGDLAAVEPMESTVPLPEEQSNQTANDEVELLLRSFVCPGGVNAQRPGPGVDVPSAEVGRDMIEFIVLSGTYQVGAALKQPQGAKCSLPFYNRRYPVGKKKDAHVILQVLQIQPGDRGDTRPPLVYAGVKSAVSYLGPDQEKSIGAVILTVWLPKANNKTSKGVFVFMGVVNTGVEDFHVLMTQRIDMKGGYRATAFKKFKTPLMTFFNDFEEAKEDNSVGWGGLQLLYEMAGLDEDDANNGEHGVVSAIKYHAHLAWDNKLPCSAESPPQAGGKKVPLTSGKITPEVEIFNPYNVGAQKPADKRVAFMGCTTRGAGRRGLEKRTNTDASSPPRDKKIDSSFDIYIATAGKDLLNTAKDKLEKANDHFNKTGTLSLAKTMKTGFISEFKTMVKSQTKSLSDALTGAVTNATTPTGGAPIKGRRAKGKKKATEAGPADGMQRADEADSGNVLTAELLEKFTSHTDEMIAKMLVIKGAIGTEKDARTLEIKELKEEILDLKGDREELKGDMANLKRLYSQHVESKDRKIEAVEREIPVILKGTSGFVSRQTYAPTRARPERVSLDSGYTPSNRSFASERAEIELECRRLAKRRENIAIMEQDSQARTEREHMEDRLVGSTYQPGGVSTTKRAGYGETRDAETRYRLAVLDSRGKSARGCVDGRQTRRRIEGGRYEDGRQEGCTMPVDIQSPQLNPTQISQDQPALGVSSGAVADGAWAYHAREDDSFPRWEHGREEYDRSRSDVVGQTERSGMAAPGCFQGKYTDPRTPNSHDGTNSQNAWG